MRSERTVLVSKLYEAASNTAVELFEVGIEKIVPRHNIRLKCAVPLCEYYGVCKVCPPNIPSIDEFEQALKNYAQAFIVVYREKIEDINKYEVNHEAELKLSAAVAALEYAATREGYYRALGLQVGGCKLCETCSPLGERCRHPYKARPSPTGFGLDLTEIAMEAKMPLEWPPVEYVSFMGLLLV